MTHRAALQGGATGPARNRTYDARAATFEAACAIAVFLGHDLGTPVRYARGEAVQSVCRRCYRLVFCYGEGAMEGSALAHTCTGERKG
jgi:hypothetical protein